MGKQGESGGNIEKHKETRETWEKLEKKIETQDNFYIYWGHNMESYMRY